MQAPTQAMANVQAAEQRRKGLAQRLAQQMAAKAAVKGRAATGRIQATGSPFQSSVAVRSAATPSLGLGFDLAPGRIRPAGFDPGSPATVYVPSAPASGGGVGVGSADTPAQPVDPSTTDPTGGTGVTQDTSVPGGFPTRPGPQLADPSGFNSDTPLTAPAPAASVTPPDPYSVMMQTILARKQALYDKYGDDTNMRIPGVQF